MSLQSLAAGCPSASESRARGLAPAGPRLHPLLHTPRRQARIRESRIARLRARHRRTGSAPGSTIADRAHSRVPRRSAARPNEEPLRGDRLLEGPTGVREKPIAVGHDPPDGEVVVDLLRRSVAASGRRGRPDRGSRRPSDVRPSLPGAPSPSPNKPRMWPARGDARYPHRARGRDR